MDNSYPQLKTIENGKVPETRMKDASAVQDYARRLIDADAGGGPGMSRARKRAMVNGLVDGNPPMSASKLRDAGRAEASNANWGTGRAYMESGSGAIYDLATETPGFASIKTSFGEEEYRDQYGLIMSCEMDRMISNDPVWDYEEQQSIWYTILHGCGPFFFEDTQKVLPRAVACGDLLVPERTRSDTHYWESCVLLVEYYPPQLYDFIRDESAAAAVGWNVEYTKEVIANAVNYRQPNNQRYDWEFVQQEMKNNSMGYIDDTLICRTAFAFWKEFDGKITQAIVEQNTTTGNPHSDGKSANIDFLFKHRGRYNNWTELAHPMYYDRGNGGYHHSVTGLGVKMFTAMQTENRVINKLIDDAMAPKTLFKPTTSEMSQRFQMATLGSYGVLPQGFEPVQNPIGGMINEGLAMQRYASDIIRGNLSGYRQPAAPDRPGNPDTKYKVQLDASKESSLTKTTFNRYYKQRDLLMTEIARRTFNLNSTDPRAKEVQRRCLEQGVPRECFGRIEKVEAVRVIGQGSTFMRKQAVDALLPIAGTLPEEGRVNLISDKIAAEAGQTAVNRYNPSKKIQKLATDQQSNAMLWVAAMKTGATPVITSSQNPVTFAATFLNAAMQAIQSVQQGASLPEVVKFLDVCGPAIGAHLRRFANDPLREPVFKTMLAQWKKVGQITDKLKEKLKAQQEQQQVQQQRTQQAMSDEEIKKQKAQSDIAIKTAKTRAQLQQSAEKHRMKIAHDAQDLTIRDASAASQIHINRMKAFADSKED